MYKTDKRTKNLTLRDIHVGDWVQVWSEQAERYSPPLKIIQICDDGTIYLVTSDEERCTPWEEDIKNVDALPIDGDILVGFGFEKLFYTNLQGLPQGIILFKIPADYYEMLRQKLIDLPQLPPNLFYE